MSSPFWGVRGVGGCRYGSDMVTTKKRFALVSAATVLAVGVALAGFSMANADDAPVPEATAAPYVNGLAGEDEAEAAAVVAAEVAAVEAARVAEEARVAAEAQAAVQAQADAAAQAAANHEAARVAAEQAVEPEPETDPAPWVPSVDPQNANGGDWDLSSCPNGASTGADGKPHCD